MCELAKDCKASITNDIQCKVKVLGEKKKGSVCKFYTMAYNTHTHPRENANVLAKTSKSHVDL